jgi:hypothetical protein
VTGDQFCRGDEFPWHPKSRRNGWLGGWRLKDQLGMRSKKAQITLGAVTRLPDDMLRRYIPHKRAARRFLPPRKIRHEHDRFHHNSPV